MACLLPLQIRGLRSPGPHLFMSSLHTRVQAWHAGAMVACLSTASVHMRAGTRACVTVTSEYLGGTYFVPGSVLGPGMSPGSRQHRPGPTVSGGERQEANPKRTDNYGQKCSARWGRGRGSGCHRVQAEGGEELSKGHLPCRGRRWEDGEGSALKQDGRGRGWAGNPAEP